MFAPALETLSPSTTFPVSLYNADLKGSDFWRAVTTVGWQPSNGRYSTVRAIGDAVRAHDIELSRFWHTAVDISGTEAHGPGSTILLLQIEGIAYVHLNDNKLIVRPNEIAVLASDHTTIRYQTDTPCAYISVCSRNQSFLGITDALAGVYPSVPTSGHMLIGLINGLLNARLESALRRPFPFLRSSIDALIHATLVELRDDRDERIGASSSHRPTMGSVLAVIEDRAPDPRFTAADIAPALGISSSSLYELFQNSGSTPAKELRKARLRLAMLHLGHTDIEQADLNVIARLSGFGSVRTLREALRRYENT